MLFFIFAWNVFHGHYFIYRLKIQGHKSAKEPGTKGEDNAETKDSKKVGT